MSEHTSHSQYPIKEVSLKRVMQAKKAFWQDFLTNPNVGYKDLPTDSGEEIIVANGTNRWISNKYSVFLETASYCVTDLFKNPATFFSLPILPAGKSIFDLAFSQLNAITKNPEHYIALKNLSAWYEAYNGVLFYVPSKTQVVSVSVASYVGTIAIFLAEDKIQKKLILYSQHKKMQKDVEKIITIIQNFVLPNFSHPNFADKQYPEKLNILSSVLEKNLLHNKKLSSNKKSITIL